MPRVTFEFDPQWEENVYRASNKQGSSLRGLYDKVRSVTDEIAGTAKRDIQGEWIRSEAATGANRSDRFSKDRKGSWLEMKARTFALSTAMNSLVPTMGFDGKEIFGRVSINRRGSASLEFGGVDPVAEIGKETGEYVNHPPYSFLRRAMDGTGG